MLTRRIEVLARMATTKPDKWHEWMQSRADSEARERESTKIDYDDFKVWVGKVINHQANILTEGDLRAWGKWLEELTRLYNPKML